MSEKRTLVVNIHQGRGFDCYIGRPKRGNPWKFGNPFIVGRHGDRAVVIAKFEKWLRTGESFGNIQATEERRSSMLANLWKLRGKRLGCFCAPEPCHGDVLVKLVEERR